MDAVVCPTPVRLTEAFTVPAIFSVAVRVPLAAGVKSIVTVQVPPLALMVPPETHPFPPAVLAALKVATPAAQLSEVEKVVAAIGPAVGRYWYSASSLLPGVFNI